MLSAFMRQPIILIIPISFKAPRPNFCPGYISMIRFIITSLRYLICLVSL